ncbi:hypothetical protein EC988_002073 [Linderina pennispora]|nr:hypothetical protein EC988_002073 [Linderina pennispora]
MQSSVSALSLYALSAKQQEFLTQIAGSFHVSDDQLSTIITKLESELARGLKTNEQCELYMSPSLVNSQKTPAGTALSMAIESSGKRVRLNSVTFNADSSIADTKTQIFITPTQCMASVDSLFEHVAYSIREFLHNYHLDEIAVESPLPLGFTIGFPVSNCGVCESAKEDSIDLDGADITQMLQDVVIRHHLPVQVTSVTNNTVSALVAAQFADKTTRVAASFNNGVNAAYYEPVSNVETFSSAGVTRNAKVAINTELGRFGSSSGVLPQTMWDRRIDRESRNPGLRSFEKLVASQYLGEIVRNLITDFIDKHLLFSVNCPVKEISTEYSFHTAYIGSIMDDETKDLAHVDGIIAAEFGIETSLADRQIVRALCEIVAARASRLSGAALAALILKSNAHVDCASIALSGALFDMNRKVYEHTIATLQEQLQRSAATTATVNLQRRDSDLIGAAIDAICY